MNAKKVKALRRVMKNLESLSETPMPNHELIRGGTRTYDILTETELEEFKKIMGPNSSSMYTVEKVEQNPLMLSDNGKFVEKEPTYKVELLIKGVTMINSPSSKRGLYKKLK